MMQTLLLEAGDFVQIKSTDLPSASLVKLQPQSINFLDISDPKAVLENAFRNFSTVTKGDVFSFHYNDIVYDVAVLEVKPENNKMGVCMLETDVSVEFAPPVGYVDPERNRNSGTSASRNTQGGLFHSHGTMAQEINYDAIAPSSKNVVAGAKTVSSNFLRGGQKLNSKKGSKPSTPDSNNLTVPQPPVRKINGPQPLRLPPNKLFFGYEIKPVKTQADKEKEIKANKQPRFEGQGQTLREGIKRKGDMEEKLKGPGKEDNVGRRLDGRKA
jgi:ubiquitin fusion degradation protein 1